MNKCLSSPLGSPASRRERNIIHGTYFPHIDGLRTFAVLAVVLYHLQEWLCPGGYTGVDIFFVISGYLIGGGLVRSLREGAFSVASFYCRRIRRIMPAYFCLIAAVLAFGCLVLDCDDLRILGRTVRSSTFFITNIYFSRTTGDYFSPATEENPLLNLWSLSVEEQFYLIIPLALWLLWKSGRASLTAVLGGAMALSLGAAAWHLGHLEQNKAFYLLSSRAWELLAGCLLALMPAITGKTRGKGLLALAGWAGILTPFICYSPSTPFPGYAALPSVAGAALLIRYGSCGWSGSILKHPACVGIGKISYSLYLWHWPVIVYWTYCRFNECNAWDYTGMFLASLALACLSWNFVEMPARTAHAFWTRGKAFLFVACGCCILGFAGEWLKWTDGARDYWHVAANNMEFPEYWRGPAFPPSFGITPPDKTLVERGNVIQTHHPDLGDVTDYPLVRLGRGDTVPSFLLIGDSHAMASSPGFDAAAFRIHQAGLFFRARLCPLSGISGSGEKDALTCLRMMYPHWEHNMDLILDWLERTPQIRTVFIHNRWIELVNKHRDERMKQLVLQGLFNTCSRIREAGRQVVLLGPVPEWTFGPRKLMRRNVLLNTKRVDRLLEGDFLTRQQPVFTLLKNMEATGLCRIVPVHGAFQKDGEWMEEAEGHLLYCDDNHLSPYGSRKMIDDIVDQLFPEHENTAANPSSGIPEKTVRAFGIDKTSPPFTLRSTKTLPRLFRQFPERLCRRPSSSYQFSYAGFPLPHTH